jgi:NADPH:quinone reductase-like Zn-dependent oxidoreductase
MNQSQMKAITLSDNGVRFEEVDLPELKPTQVLVRVASSSVNRSDLMTARVHPET